MACKAKPSRASGHKLRAKSKQVSGNVIYRACTDQISCDPSQARGRTPGRNFRAVPHSTCTDDRHRTGQGEFCPSHFPDSGPFSIKYCHCIATVLPSSIATAQFIRSLLYIIVSLQYCSTAHSLSPHSLFYSHHIFSFTHPNPLYLHCLHISMDIRVYCGESDIELIFQILQKSALMYFPPLLSCRPH